MDADQIPGFTGSTCLAPSVGGESQAAVYRGCPTEAFHAALIPSPGRSALLRPSRNLLSTDDISGDYGPDGASAAHSDDAHAATMKAGPDSRAHCGLGAGSGILPRSTLPRSGENSSFL